MDNVSRGRLRRLLLWCAVALVAAVLVGAVAGGVVWENTHIPVVAQRSAVAVGACGLAGCAAMAVVSLLSERRRDARVAELAERVDLIVRGAAGPQDLDDYEEGELAVLANELQKMCVLLRDQAEGLRRERDGLADELADISHQLRTPLMAMGLAVELLGRPDTTPERRRELLHELRRTSDSMNWLVTSLLTLARADAGSLQLTSAPVDVAALVEESVAPLRIACELKGVELQVVGPRQDPGEGPGTAGGSSTGDEDVPRVTYEGDAGWSREALANIVKNCMEHTPGGGFVRVAFSQDAVATRITVTDSGPGISQADLPHVFERFYKGSGSASGSAGIGLALARCLVTSQGGTLKAANAPAGGARFEMTFPRTVV